MLLGDAAHTAHFSIGSGTKLAMEDATALAWALKDRRDDLAAALLSYEEDRRPIVESTQRAAQASLEWFEGISRYVGQSPPQFAFNLLTRSRRITYENLTMRDAEFMRRVDEDFHRRLGADVAGEQRRPARAAAADVHAAASCARWSSPTASSSARWTCTRRSTGRSATSTSSTSAAAASAAPAW